MRKYAKEHRERLLVKLSRKKDGKEPSEVLEAYKVIAKYRKEQENIEPALSRLESLDCPDSVCPNCLWLHGVTVNLKSISSDSWVDRYNCPECNSTFSEPA